MQLSTDYDESKVRRGVCGCETIEEFGQVLVLPETAEVSEDTAVLDLISYLSYLIDRVEEDPTLTYDQLVEKAEEWLENNR